MEGPEDFVRDRECGEGLDSAEGEEEDVRGGEVEAVGLVDGDPVEVGVYCSCLGSGWGCGVRFPADGGKESRDHGTVARIVSAIVHVLGEKHVCFDPVVPAHFDFALPERPVVDHIEHGGIDGPDDKTNLDARRRRSWDHGNLNLRVGWENDAVALLDAALEVHLGVLGT